MICDAFVETRRFFAGNGLMRKVEKEMKTWAREQLKISENQKYLMEGNKTFFWLGDTAWLMLQKLTKEEIRMYLRNRKEKGYNVIQTVLAHTIPGEKHSGSLAPGYKDVTAREYWEFVDEIVEMAREMGMYLGLLPSWGSVVKNEILNMENIERYIHFLGERYQEYPNIIWILGGDIRGDVNYPLFCKEGEILKSYNPERIIAYHPFGRTSSSLWFHNEKWLDMNMYQSGHRRYDQEFLGEWDDNKARETFFGEDNWRYVERDHGYEIMKPTLDAEPSYEGIPQGLHNPRNPYWEEWDVRRYAYWSVLAGACGHTYGNNAIMQFYAEGEEAPAYGVREGWKDAVHHAGCAQLKYLKELMEQVDYINGKPDDAMLCFGQKERYHRVSVFAGDDFVICYDYMGDQFMLDLTRYHDMEMDAYWMNPQDGTYSYIDTLKGTEKWLASPVARKGNANDWVLFLKKADERQAR